MAIPNQDSACFLRTVLRTTTGTPSPSNVQGCAAELIIMETILLMSARRALVLEEPIGKMTRRYAWVLASTIIAYLIINGAIIPQVIAWIRALMATLAILSTIWNAFELAQPRLPRPSVWIAYAWSTAPMKPGQTLTTLTESARLRALTLLSTPTGTIQLESVCSTVPTESSPIMCLGSRCVPQGVLKCLDTLGTSKTIGARRSAQSLTTEMSRVTGLVSRNAPGHTMPPIAPGMEPTFSFQTIGSAG